MTLDENRDRGEMPANMMLLQMLSGQMVSHLIGVAARLGLADLLKEQARSADELALEMGVDARSLYRVLRGLAGLGIFSEGADGRFSMTPIAESLRSDVAGSLRDFAIFINSEWRLRAWGDILYSVQTGQMAFEHVYGMDGFTYMTQNPESAKLFDAAMTSFSKMVAPQVVAGYDFSSINKLVDVAGGQGFLLSSILKANPRMKGVLFDLPHVIENARPQIEAQGVADRCELLSGNFFEGVPEGGDAYIMKHIIHDWDDERSITILKNCHRAMKDNGKLLLVELVIPQGNEPFFGKLLDIEMLVMTPGGRERTEAEYRELLAAAGFRLNSITPTLSGMSVIEGMRV